MVVSVKVSIQAVLLQIFPLEPSNIATFFAFDVAHLSHSVRLNDPARWNMYAMFVTLDTSHLEMSPLNADAEANMAFMPATLDTTQLEMSPLNADADSNMRLMSVTLDTSH